MRGVVEKCWCWRTWSMARVGMTNYVVDRGNWEAGGGDKCRRGVVLDKVVEEIVSCLV